MFRSARPQARLGLQPQTGRSAKCRWADQSVWKRSVREVSAYSTVYPELGQEAARRRNLRRPMGFRLKRALDQKARWFRKACNLPASPRLPAASCHLTCVSNSVGRVQTAKSFSRYAASLSPSVSTCPRASPSAVPGWLKCVSLLFEANETRMPRFEKFRHRTTLPILL
jgi:hypothetical protein